MEELLNNSDSLGNSHLLYKDDPFICGTTYPTGNSSVFGFYDDFDDQFLGESSESSEQMQDDEFDIGNPMYNEMNMDNTYHGLNAFNFNFTYPLGDEVPLEAQQPTTSKEAMPDHIEKETMMNTAMKKADKYVVTEAGKIRDSPKNDGQVVVEPVNIPRYSAEYESGPLLLDSPDAFITTAAQDMSSGQTVNEVARRESEETKNVKPSYNVQSTMAKYPPVGYAPPQYVPKPSPPVQAPRPHQNYNLFPVKVHKIKKPLPFAGPRHVPYQLPPLKSKSSKLFGRVDPENISKNDTQAPKEVQKHPEHLIFLNSEGETVLRPLKLQKMPKLKSMKIDRDRQSNHAGCSYCPQNFGNQLSLEFHEVEKHADKYCYECRICQKHFVSVHVINRHLQLDHRAGKLPLLNHSVFAEGAPYDQKRAINGRRVSGMIWSFMKDHLADAKKLTGTTADDGIIKKHANEIFHPTLSNCKPSNAPESNNTNPETNSKDKRSSLVEKIKKRFIYGENTLRHKIKDVPTDIDIDLGLEPISGSWLPPTERVILPVIKGTPVPGSPTSHSDSSQNFANGKNPQPLAMPPVDPKGSSPRTIVVRGPIAKPSGLASTRFPLKQPAPGKVTQSKVPKSNASESATKGAVAKVVVTTSKPAVQKVGNTIAVNTKGVPEKAPVWIDPLLRGHHSPNQPYVLACLRRPNAVPVMSAISSKKASNPYH